MSKKTKIGLVLLILFFLLIGYGFSHTNGYFHPKKNDMRISVGKELKVEFTDKYFNVGGNEKNHFVKRVIDGDTVELENGERVRYIGIDAPETVDPRKSVQCFGKEASLENKKMVEGKVVRLEKDISDKDKYGRLLRYVYQGDVFINLELVKRGYAHTYTYPPDVKDSALFLEAEKEAREAHRGLWDNCPYSNK